MQIFGHFEGFPLKSVMVWVGSTMTPVERSQLLWPKHKFKIRWSEKIRKHGWILWCIYIYMCDCMICVDLSFQTLCWFMLYIIVNLIHGIYWNVLKYIELWYWNMFFQKWKRNQDTKPIKTIHYFHRHVVMAAVFMNFQGGWLRKWSWYQRRFTVFFRDETWEILLSLLSVFFS